ncbi:MAG: TlpA family protein disulfide reductase [Lysobacter sp.]|nr:TlpA family protein disulfide reductase [Lysobacter sp.]
MRGWLPLAGIGLLAALAGVSLWLAGRHAAPPPMESGPVDVTPAAIQAARFVDGEGAAQSLGQFSGKVVVVNFWATWCTPCREEMPGFVKLQARWKDRGVQFVGLAQDDPAKVAAFGRELGVNYPLWLGGAEVMDLSRRLGNRLGVLPHTVLLDAQGRVVESRIGIYAESMLDSRLAAVTGK